MNYYAAALKYSAIVPEHFKVISQCFGAATDYYAAVRKYYAAAPKHSKGIP